MSRKQAIVVLGRIRRVDENEQLAGLAQTGTDVGLSMACDRCRDLCTSFRIDEAFHLTSALRVVRDNLADETIRIVSQAGDLKPAGPWPAQIDCSFACTTCEQQWTLVVATTERIEGEWKPVVDARKQEQDLAEARRKRRAGFPPPGSVEVATVKMLRSLLKRSSFAAHADAIMATARPCIQLEPVPTVPENVTLGQSRIGGGPLLPVDFEWPEYEGASLDFICQINLAVLPKGTLPDLPRKGLLSFFYAIDAHAHGDRKEDRGASLVHFWDGSTKLFAHEADEDDELGCHTIRFVPGLTLPNLHDPAFADLSGALSEAQRASYFDFVQTVALDHHLMGHPGHLQDLDMRAGCVANAGLPRTKGNSGIDAWRLLLQIGGDSHPLGLPWDGVGRLYVWIRQDDLAAACFDRCWTTFQST